MHTAVDAVDECLKPLAWLPVGCKAFFVGISVFGCAVAIRLKEMLKEIPKGCIGLAETKRLLNMLIPSCQGSVGECVVHVDDILSTFELSRVFRGDVGKIIVVLGHGIVGSNRHVGWD